MIHRHLASLIFAVALLPPTGLRAAEILHTWVSAAGNDANDCSRGNPCATLGVTHNNTKPNGIIHCADGVAYSGITITKSITIDCTGTGAANADPQFLNNVGVLIIQTAASDTVILRGLRFNFGQRTEVFVGVDVQTAGNVIIDDMHITNSGNAGINFRPTGAGRLTITNSLITRNGTGASGAGVRIIPQSGGSAQVSIKNSTISGNVFGVAFDGSASSGGINATIVDSIMSSNSNDGIVATSSSGAAPIGVTVINSQSVNNGFGIRSIGSNVTVRVEGSKIIGNGVGLSGGGALITGGGNTVQANANNGSFNGSYPLQ